MEDIQISNAVELLLKWDFSEETQLAFLNARIELDKFLSLGLTDLQAYVPDDAERLKLVTCIFKYKRDQLAAGAQSTENSKVASDPNSSSDNPTDSDFNPDDFINKDNSNDSEGSDSDEPLSTAGKKVPKKKKDASKELIVTSTPTRKKDTTGSEAPLNFNDETPSTSTADKNTSLTSATSTPKNKSKLGQQTEDDTTPRRLKSILSKNQLQNFDLKQYLTSKKTRSAVFCGNYNNGVLIESNRKLLVKILAEYLLDITTSPSVDDFTILREKIYEVFPNEPQGLYYKAPRESGDHQTLAKGKLFDKVRNSIGKLIKNQALVSRRKRKTDTPVIEEVLETEESSTTPEVKAALLFLKRSRELTPDVEDKWKLSAAFRLQELIRSVRSAKPTRGKKKKTNEVDKAADYLKEYKVLSQPRGHVLVVSDFKHLYPDHSENLFNSWPAVQRQIHQVALRSQLKDPIGTELLGYLKKSDNDEDDFKLDDDCRDAVLLQLLSSLCPATARVVIGKKSFKPSVLEARDAFICHTTVGADLEPLLERRRKRMAELNAPLQPYMILLGETRATISAVYVAFDRTLYKLSCVLQALDTCFKLFHACQMNYPPEANHLWHLFHLYVYKLKHEPEIDGEVPMSTSVFISSLGSL